MAKTEIKEESDGAIAALLLFVALAVLFALIIFGCVIAKSQIISCKMQSAFNKDRYCPCKMSDLDSKHICNARTHSHDLEEQKARAEAEKLESEKQAKEQACYDKSKHSVYYDLREYYGLNCKQINYLNEHLIDRKEDGGYLSGSYSGFFSSGSIQGKSFIVMRSLADRMIIQNATHFSYCDGIEKIESIDYYDEAELVEYYVQECIK